jgi:hypothetical protein
MAITKSRYFQNTVIKDNVGQQILNTWTSSKAEDLISDSDILVTMRQGFRLDKLAKKYLGDEKYWFAIAMLNNMKHFWDFINGQQLRIPTSINRFLVYIKTNIDKS